VDGRVDGLAVIDGGGMYQYKEVGLDYVWLRNGFDYRDTPRGRLVRVHDRDGLHAAIARWIVNNPGRLRGQEVRFLRSMLGLSQDAFGKLVRQSRPTIARWEANPQKAIPSGSDDWLRMVYIKKAEGDVAVCRLMDLLVEFDKRSHRNSDLREALFKDNNGKWALAA
jgi:DNA-binding transcriptional regulator YiaG